MLCMICKHDAPDTADTCPTCGAAPWQMPEAFLNTVSLFSEIGLWGNAPQTPFFYYRELPSVNR